MKGKKGKTGLKKARRRAPKENVQASTSLPPEVEGQLRCYLRVSVTKIVWTISNPPDIVHVRLRWWGELSSGTVYRPFDIKNHKKSTLKSIARFPIRCGPKQFATYLNDMGTAVFEVLRGQTMTLMGKAQINEIGHLAPTRPINGLFNVFSNKNAEKIAELQISLVFEPLPVSYESSSSMPTTDMSMLPRESDRSGNVSSASRRDDALKQQPISYQHSVASTNDPSPRSKIKEPRTNIRTPRGVDSDYSFVIGPGYTAGLSSKDTTTDVSKMETKFDEYKSKQNKEYLRKSDSAILETEILKPPTVALHPLKGEGLDLISNLLNRGTQLRNNMIQAELDSWKNPAMLASQPLRRSDELLHVLESDTRHQLPASVRGHEIMDPFRVDTHDSTEFNDLETRTVELVLGDAVPNNKLKLLQKFQDDVDAVSVSSNSDADGGMMSELEDPIHDDTILKELFYKNVESSSDSLSDILSSEDEKLNQSNNRSISIDDPGNIRPPSRKSSRVSSRQGSHSSQPETGRELGHRLQNRDDVSDDDVHSLSARSEGSRVSFDDVIEDEVKGHGCNVVEGLSIERLTLLGRVNVARVNIDHMILGNISSEAPTPSRTPRSRKLKSRPPRPVQKRKRTYLVEYKFPVVATSRDGGSKVTTATEVMRLASKKVQESNVTFTHRSVFPVRFDETAVNRWWQHLLVFKIFTRTAGQKTPDLLGVASVSLRSVLESSGLGIQVEIPVKDKKDRGRWSGSDSDKLNEDGDKIVAHLQISVELASDSKNFMQDLAKVKVAEMKGSQLLAVPSHKAPTKITPPAKTDAKHQKDDISDLEKPSNEMSTQTKGHSSVGRGQPSRIPVYQGRHVRNDTCGRFQQKSVDEHNEIYVKKLHSGVQNPMQQTPANTQPEPMTLHCLLHIPTGSGLTLQGIAPLNHTKPHPHPKHSSGIGITGFGRDNVTRNTYLVCRMFWCDDVVNSNVCWGTTEPDYEFLQIAPVLVSPSLLERTRNNFMIVEVWDKKTSAENDQLVGIVKLPLHQFYMSYRDPRISTAMLKSKFPVVAVDSSLPVVDPFTGVKYGQLKVLLSLGLQGQISELQRVKLDKESNVPLPDRPDHFLERANGLGTDDSTSGTHMIEHTFEVIVEGIRGFPQFQDTVWGEADCFVQYHFPSLLQQPQTSQLIKHAPPSLKPHRTATTLCIPEPMFHDICRHRLVIPSSIPVQRELLTACAGVGGGAGGIPFEVWCRYYCPNIRDQVLAKATLPLAKLCAMVTMQKRGETSVQSFSLPLRPQLESDENDSEKRAKLHDAGLLDITINYKTSNIKTPAEHGLSKPTGSQVCISVGILRACGLKAAAKSVARHDAGMQYPSDVGVNSYVKAVMSFLSNDEIRVTQSVARNFAPEFAHYVDFPCPLWFSEESEAGGISLAEVLESGDITFQVWHQVPGFKSDLDVKSLDTDVNRSVTARRLFSSSGDILLASSTIPLKRLLTSKTGVKGWYPLYIPPLGWDNASEAIQSLQHQEKYAPKSASQSPNDRVGGGLEVLISLAHQHDQEKVIHAARSLGWAPDDSMQDMEGWPKQDDHMMMTSQIDINVDVAVFPVICALRAGQTQIDKHAKAYIRYKFYDKAAVLATLSYLDDEDGESLQADMQHSHRFRCHSTEPFIWYLKEERLEIQLWISYNDTVDNQTRPRQRDKLIGCSYLDLSPLAREFRETQRIGGRYPVFKPGAAYLGGAFLRVHVTRKQTRQHRQDFIDDEETIPDDFIAIDRQKQRKQEIQKKQKEEEIKQREKEETERLQAIEEEKLRKEEEEKWKRRPVRVHVVVEQAMHIGCHTDWLNTFYVSYQTTEGVITSPSAAGCDRITWGFDHEAKVNRDVLENQNLIFKIWQQTSKEPNTANDRVLGFVSVDLCPLLAGFKLINGWYNIMDFSGQCQGQLKIGISPLESISPLKQPVNPTQQSTMMSPRPKTTSFQSSSQYTEFPSHLVQYPEQTIQCCDSKSTEPSIQEASHFEDHLKNVRQFHESLQQKLVDLGTREKSRSQHTPSLGVLGSDTSTSFMMNSKSFLRRSLRDNLEQLDIIQENLKKKLRGDQVQGRSHPEDYDDSERHRSQGKNHKHRQSDLSRGQARSQITSNHIKEKNHVQDNYPELITSGFSHFENGQQNPGSTNFEHHDADEMNYRLVDGYKDDEPYGSMRSPDERVRSPQSLENKSDKNEAESCMSAPTTYPVPTGELINLDNEISNLNNPRTFERDSSSNIHYEKLENIEDLLPARPPPSHWDPLEQKTDSDWESGSDFEEVIPKPLNDISSQEFSNSIVPDKVDKHQFKNVDFDEDIQQQTSSFNQPSDLKNGGKTSKPEDVLRTAKSEEDVENTCGQQRLDRDSSFIVLSTDSRSQQDITDLQSENQHINDQNVDRPQEISSNKNGCGEGEYGNDNETENIVEGLTDHQALESDHQALQSDQTLQSDHQELESDHQALKDAAGSVSGEENADDNDSVVITINSEEAAMQKDRFERKQETKASEPARQQPVLMPNFFLPPADLEASMRALRTAASVLPQQAVQPQNRQYSTSKAAAVKEVADRLHKPKDQKDPPRPKTRNRPPTAEEAKRIAKIFSAKFSTS